MTEADVIIGYLGRRRSERLSSLQEDRKKVETAAWVTGRITDLVQIARDKEVSLSDLFSVLSENGKYHGSFRDISEQPNRTEAALLIDASKESWSNFFASVDAEITWLFCAKKGLKMVSHFPWYDKQLRATEQDYVKNGEPGERRKRF